MIAIQSDLRSLAKDSKATVLSRFFKTGPWEYGEGDLFLGIPVPAVRKIVAKYAKTASFDTVRTLLESEFHEERLAGVLFLVDFAKREKFALEEIAKFYLNNAKRVNNWDLVDVSSEHIVGPYLAHGLSSMDRAALTDACVTSPHLWTNRIIVLASFYEIKHGNPEGIFALAPRFFKHPHDLIHKAVGWMLREAGKRASIESLTEFLNRYADKMPRTMLRYAIERLPETQRLRYLAIKRSNISDWFPWNSNILE